MKSILKIIEKVLQEPMEAKREEVVDAIKKDNCPAFIFECLLAV